MTKKMLIDAAQSEEIRVAVVDRKKVEDFDFESSSRKPLRGNIYLARITRVEPSLQAAFVEYGGNRHGFLAFSEIHPDYYQIPVSDREVLQDAEKKMASLAEELEIFQNGEDEDEDNPDTHDDENQIDDEGSVTEDNGVEEDNDPDYPDNITPDYHETQDDNEIQDDDEIISEVSNDDDIVSSTIPLKSEELPTLSDELQEDTAGPELTSNENDGDFDDEAPIDVVSANDDHDETDSPHEDKIPSEADLKRKARREKINALHENYQEARREHARILRNYKIQEVIKARQILLIQVVKEERGNKGAALTSYLSLAGRYCVLMPNTARGGGISRKIPSAADRKRLRRIVNDLDVTQGMGLIIRTAGAKRTKSEIKRDYDYLLRLWETIRNLTMDSVAPSLIYEEANLIKRAIRDLYDKDISRIIVEGEDGYREAKDFMKMLMPSHAKNVQAYREPSPLFMRYDVEQQLDSMYQPSVRLKSGGYLVIHQTEALIAVDVNSGKATRERNIETTAVKTNLEAAQEVARQCKLRDLAGLIVIDFIDMEDMKNNRAVEKRLKESMKGDRARIQIGRISSFGLMEMSRQRRRSGIVDGTTNACPTCNGSGAVRSHEMAALRILRAIENEAISSRSAIIAARTSFDVALYILNHKREWLSRIENQHGLKIEVAADPVKAGDQYEIERRGPNRALPQRNQAVQADLDNMHTDEEDDKPSSHSRSKQNNSDSDEEGSGRKRRRRRRKRKGAHDDDNTQNTDAKNNEQEGEQTPTSNLDEQTSETSISTQDEDGEDKPKKRRRRGRRGGRRNQENKDTNTQDLADNTDHTEQKAGAESIEMKEGTIDSDPSENKASGGETFSSETSDSSEKPKRKRSYTRKSARKTDGDAIESDGTNSGDEEAKKATAKTTKKRAPRKRTSKAKVDTQTSADSVDDTGSKTSNDDDGSNKAEGTPKAKKAPSRKRTTKKAKGPDATPSDDISPSASIADMASEKKPKKERKGWWQRALGGE